jgi:AraC-like DNA-binding protein
MAKASVSAIITILRNAQALGLDVEELKRSVGLPADALDDPDTRVDSEIGFRLMNEAERVSKDSLFGLHHGSQFQASDMGLVGYLVLNAPTIWMALDSFCKYQNIYGEGLQLETSNRLGKVEVSFTVHHELESVAGDCAFISHMAGFISTIKWLLGKHSYPLSATLRINKPNSLQELQEYESCFGQHIEFGQKTYRLVFDESDFKQNILTSNQELYSMVESRAQSVLQDIGEQNTFSQTVARELHKSLDQGKPSLEGIARLLCKSPRTVQRQLKEEGTSFQQVLDQVREKLAKYYLKTRNLNIDEIAFLLGFSESSAFRKAFKKWTQMSPEIFRTS